MEHILTLTPRELKSILHAFLYEKHCNHGDVGHNQMLLIAKLADYIGMELGSAPGSVDVPSKVRVEEPATTGRGGT